MKFTRHAQHRKKRIARSGWRKPKGLHNKQRLQKRGSTPVVQHGYMSPKATRGKKRGLDIIKVHNIAEVEAVDPKTQGVIVGGIGMKKKIAVLKKIAERKLTYFRGDATQEATQLEQRFADRKKLSEEKAKEKQATQKELAKKAEEAEKQAKAEETAEEKADEESEESAEKQKKQEEQDKAKVLTKAK